MFTSDSAQRIKMAKIGFKYLLASLFCAFFGAVYEQFSHEVYSGFMIYAFAFPLALGALPFFALSLYGCRMPGETAIRLYGAGIATLTVGSVMEGVLIIYGTTNPLLKVYWLVGLAFMTAALLLYAARVLFGERRTRG